MNVERKPIFSTKEEVDSWYHAAVEDMERAMATEAYHSRKLQASGEYRILLTCLDRTKERLYASLGIKDTPAKTTIEEIVGTSLIGLPPSTN